MCGARNLGFDCFVGERNGSGTRRDGLFPSVLVCGSDGIVLPIPTRPEATHAQCKPGFGRSPKEVVPTAWRKLHLFSPLRGFTTSGERYRRLRSSFPLLPFRHGLRPRKSSSPPVFGMTREERGGCITQLADDGQNNLLRTSQHWEDRKRMNTHGLSSSAFATWHLGFTQYMDHRDLGYPLSE